MHSSEGTKVVNRIIQLVSQRHRALLGTLLAALVVAIVLATTWSAWAAVELAYFTASSTANSVLLEWGTVQEYNLDGFAILCKRANEPDTAYHPIGARIAQGGPEQGAEYSLSVTTGVEFGTAYCFRLEEKTTDGSPGEQFDICGYGPGITPTAVLTTTLADTAEITPTTIIVESPPGATPAPTLDQTPTATWTVTPGQGASPLSGVTSTVTPTPTETFTATPTQMQPSSPLDQPETSLGGEDDGVGNPAQLPANEAMSSTPTSTLTSTLTSTPTVSPTPTATVTQALTSTSLAESVPAPATPTLDPSALAQEPGVPGVDGTGDGEPTPTPLYVVVTATPTSEMLAMAVPTFTPWPTATPVQTFNLANLLAPNTQNLMVMLLCLIFLSASGLGTLGLITSVLYMRSQAKQSRYPDPRYERRRYW